MPRILRNAATFILAAPLAIVLAVCLFMPLGTGSQFLFGLSFVGAALLASQTKARYATALICLLTLFTSTRYMIWRATHTLVFDSPAEMVFGCGLYAAECYTWVVMLLSLAQSSWPLQRPIVPLVGEPTQVPRVDVYVPTYNESLAVVGPSVLAAMDMDYPKDRFRVFLLDDGKRPEFAAFAQEAGCEYITRDNNQHAKAGNLNEAMKVTDGDLICIFDCDHVPTRAFLQMTVGWFQATPKLALVQTPHFFYSPDPIQRNLRVAKDMPGEGDLFYDTIQSGNDLWDATFFCGSCAVIRREALESVGGFAFETVTEDAHTALRIQRQGWSTAFLNLRLSAGLATETLSQHVAQRVRWCRGMTQILRIDNPMSGKGLKLHQRLCYLNALLYYQFPLVRVAFLTSPLLFLFFGLNLIKAPAALVFAYSLPHLLQGLIANQRLQGKQRGIFWGEIYETILAFHLVKPSIGSLISPAAGKFNVTDKGQLLEKGFFDTDLVKPHLVTVGLLLLGLMFAWSKLLWPDVFHQKVGAVLLNSGWTAFNLLILLTAIAVGREARQIRSHVRRPLRLPVTLYFEDGCVADAVTDNVSTGGLAVTLPDGVSHEGRKVTDVTLPIPGGVAALPVQEVALVGRSLRMQFDDLTIERQRLLVRALMGRADAWQSEPRAPSRAAWLEGLQAVFQTSASTVDFVGRMGWRLIRSRMGAPATAAGLAALSVALAATAIPDRAMATEGPAQQVLPLARLKGFAVAPVAACGPGSAGRFELSPDQVVTGAVVRLALAAGSSASPVVVLLNGQKMATLHPDASRRLVADIDPAAVLPGINQLQLAAPDGACDASLRIDPAQSAIELDYLSLSGVTAKAPDATLTPKPAPTIAAAAPPPAVRTAAATPPPLAAPRPDSQPVMQRLDQAIEWFERHPYVLALAAIGVLALGAQGMTSRLQAQVRQRLGELQERPA